MGGVFHVVQFKFNSGLSEQRLKEICDRVLALRQQCIHPTTRQPYIKVIYGGKENPIEGMQDGHTHTFIVEFDSVADRDYYAVKDPAHRECVQYLGTVVAQIHIVDFVDGVYE
ncbi:stress responsive A/B barrel domain protein [Hypoxylon cercidicola]|nr:stress responsive A/B barrel domain protein [Hypoxylon cercidicola]